MSKTHEQFMLEFEKRQPNNFKNIEVISKYIKALEGIEARCKLDNHRWKPTPSGLLNGKGCPVCGGTMQKTHEQFMHEFELKQPISFSKIKIIGKYKKALEHIECQCLVCNDVWNTTTPSGLLNGRGCTKCSHFESRKNLRKTKEQFLKEFKDKQPHNYKTIEVIGEYMSLNTKIEAICKIDGHEWSPTPEKLLLGRGCPKCRASHGEKVIDYLLKEKDVKNKPQKTFKDLIGLGGSVLRFDFAIKQKNNIIGLIEYNGQQHYSPTWFANKRTKDEREASFKIQQVHDNYKIEYSIKNKIPLLIIPYWYYDDIEKLLDDFIFKINYFNNNNLVFNFDENTVFLNDINTFKLDELRMKYKDCKTKIGTLIEYNGEIHNIKDWAVKLGIKKGTLWARFNNGDSVEKALSSIINKNNEIKLNYNKQTYNQRELSDLLNIPESYICTYLKQNFSIDEIIERYKNRIIKRQTKIEYNGIYYNKKELSDLLCIPWTSFGRQLDKYKDIYFIANNYGKHKKTVI